MPLVTVVGVSEWTNGLDRLRAEIVDVVSINMEVSPNWVRTSFPVDGLGEPVEEKDGAKTIMILLHTALFQTEADDEKALVVTRELAGCVWRFLDGRREVECFVADLSPGKKWLIEARGQ